MSKPFICNAKADFSQSGASAEQWTRDDKRNRLVTERCGYAPLRSRVLGILQSGERLLEVQKNAFVYAEDEEPEDFVVDMTLQPDFDELEALQAKKMLTREIENQIKNTRLAGSVKKAETSVKSESKKTENEVKENERESV